MRIMENPHPGMGRSVSLWNTHIFMNMSTSTQKSTLRDRREKLIYYQGDVYDGPAVDSPPRGLDLIWA